MPLLSIFIFLPFMASLLFYFIPNNKLKLVQYCTIAITLIEIVFFGFILYQFNTQDPNYQLVEKLDWFTLPLGKLGIMSIDYSLGVDGFSVAMLGLSVVVFSIASIASISIDKKNKTYSFLLMLMFSSVLGCFAATDMFLFYMFFEFMLLPMYFLIGIWGGPRKEYAAIKFFLYTLAGSVLILLAMIALSWSVIDPVETARLMGITDLNKIPEMLQSGLLDSKNLVHTFRFSYFKDFANYIPGSILDPQLLSYFKGYSVRNWTFGLLFVGFLIKLPTVPFHTWLPDAHVEAPTPISVVLAGILLKVGGYGLLRIGYGFFPDSCLDFAWIAGLLGSISIVYGALNALAMNDLKKLVAYSSVSHMGFVLLGLASGTVEGISGSVYQMVSHGIISSFMFLIVGVLYDRYHDRSISNFRGMALKMPTFTAIAVIGFFASLGLPGFSGFIAEMMVFLGAFSSPYLPIWMTIVAMSGLVLSAAYCLWALQRVFFGQYWISHLIVDYKTHQPKDLTNRELTLFVPLIILMIVMGLMPSLLQNVYGVTINHFFETLLITK